MLSSSVSGGKIVGNTPSWPIVFSTLPARSDIRECCDAPLAGRGLGCLPHQQDSPTDSHTKSDVKFFLSPPETRSGVNHLSVNLFRMQQASRQALSQPGLATISMPTYSPALPCTFSSDRKTPFHSAAARFIDHRLRTPVQRDDAAVTKPSFHR